MQQTIGEAAAVALITVCMDEESIHSVLQAAGCLNASIVPIDFGAYLSKARFTHLPHKFSSADVGVAFVDFDQDPDLARETASHLHQLFPRKLFIVALSSDTDPEMPIRAMRAGCTEFLLKPLDTGELGTALIRLQARWSEPLGRLVSNGRVLSFFGSKGGVGTTTLAIHLATHLVGVHKKKVLLIDNHPQLGHICLYLGIDGSKFHFQELTRNVSRLDRELLNGFVAKHPSGLDVLASPDEPSELVITDPDAMERTLEFVKSEYDFVILDCATFFDGSNIAAIRNSDQVFIVSTPDIGAIRDMSRYVEALLSNDQSLDKFQVVMNRFSSKDALSPEQVQKAVKLPLMLRIPNSYAELVNAINSGIPLRPNPKSEFSVQITKWSASLVQQASSRETVKKKKFSLWKSRN